MSFEERIRTLGIEMPAAPAPVAAYIPGLRVGQLLFTSGQLPLQDGKLAFQGKLGKDLDVRQGYQAARLCMINTLAVAREIGGDLDAVRRICKLTVFVHCTDEFTEQPKVANGASELLEEIFGDVGKHVRSAVGTNALPLGAPVEVEAIIEFH